MSFREQFLKTPPGPAREKLVYETLTKQPPPKTVPITVTTKDGTKITYQVSNDMLSYDGVRLPMSGTTAQRVADHFNMNLPTPKIVNQIYQAADTKLKANPMSAGGMINGKYYSGQQVVNSKISDSDTSIAFNERIQNDLKNKSPNLVAGHMKEITAPEAPGKLGLYGLYDSTGKPIQNSAFTPHDIHNHTEYASGVRLVSDNVTITSPDGKRSTMTMEQLMKDPNLAKALSTSGKLTRYAPKDSTQKPIQQSSIPEKKQKKSPAQSQAQQSSYMERINKFLDSIKSLF